MKLSELAIKVGGHLQNYTTDVDINGIAPVEEAESGDIAYIANRADREAARESGASAFIVEPGFRAGRVPSLCGVDPYLLFARVLQVFCEPPRYEPGIHPTAVIHESAKIGPNASIGPYVVIDCDVEIGSNAVLLPHVVIYRGACIGNNFLAHAHAVVREYCHLGNNVILQNGAMIGTDGFGFVRDPDADSPKWKKVLHLGPVILGDHVEVQSNACINRSDNGHTCIGSGAKVGDLVHVAHKANIADNTLLLAQVAVAGRVNVGKNVVISGQAGIAGNCEIGDDAVVLAQGGVIGRVQPGTVVMGFPAIDHRQFLRSFAVFRRLPQLMQKIQQSEWHVTALAGSVGDLRKPL